MSPWVAALAVVGLVWLLILTLMVAALLRHIGNMQLVLSSGAGGSDFNFDTDGPPLFEPLPQRALDGLQASGVDVESDRIAIFLSSGCSTCWERAAEIVSHGEGLDRLLFLVTGSNELGLDQIRRISDGSNLPVVYDPRAHDIVKALGINSTPFGFRFVGGRIIAKTYLRNFADFAALTAASIDGARLMTSLDEERRIINA